MKWMASCLAMAACLAGAAAASAGTSTTNGTASMNVVSQCTVTGATVNLGTYRTTDTLQDLANRTGYWDGAKATVIAGTNRIGTVPLGSVTCDNGTPYSITIDSDGWYGSVDIPLPAGVLELIPFVKKIGDKAFTSGSAYYDPFGIWPSRGNLEYFGNMQQVGTTATGAPQQIMGTVVPLVYFTTEGGYMRSDAQFGQAGVYSGSWVTTLNF